MVLVMASRKLSFTLSSLVSRSPRLVLLTGFLVNIKTTNTTTITKFKVTNIISIKSMINTSTQL